MSKASTKKDNYWRLSLVRGVLSLIAGLVLVLSNTRRVNVLTILVASSLLVVLIVDLIDILVRKKAKEKVLSNIIIIILELILVALLFVSTLGNLIDVISFGLRVNCIAGFAIIYSFLSIIRGFKDRKVGLERFVLVVDGLIGIIAGAAMIFGHFYELTYVLIFGAFLMVDGLASTILATSNKSAKRREK